jgi:hypothetical protein
VDPVNAFKWYILSFQKGDVIGRYKYHEFSLHHSLTQHQIIQARSMASEFLAAHHLPPIPDISTNSADTDVLPKSPRPAPKGLTLVDTNALPTGK